MTGNSERRTAMAKSTSGGGISSNKLVCVGVKGGSRTTQVVSPRGVSQLGIAQGGKLRREGSFTGINTANNVFEGNKPAATQMGNAVAASTVCGVGGSRTIYKTGYQSMHGDPVQGSTPAPKDILSQFGPDSPASSLVRKR
jgi:hypothetical protein